MTNSKADAETRTRGEPESPPPAVFSDSTISIKEMAGRLKQQARNRTEHYGLGAEKVTYEWQAADMLERLAVDREELT